MGWIRDDQQSRPAWLRYAGAVAVVLLASLLSLVLHPWLTVAPLAPYFAAVALAAWFGGVKPAISAIVLALPPITFFALEPVGVWEISRDEEGAILIFILVSALLVLLSASRDRAEQSSQESDARFRLAEEAGNVGVWDWDVAADRTFWSATMWSLCGLRPEAEPPGNAVCLSRLHPDDRSRVEAALARLLTSDLTEYRDEFRVVLPDGVQRWIEVIARVSRDEAGHARRISGVNLDITDRKVAAAAMHRARARAEALAEATRILTEPNLPQEAVLTAIAQQAAVQVGDLAVIRLISSDGEWLEPVAVGHPDPSVRETALATLVAERHPVRQGVNGAALREGRPQRLDGVALAESRAANPGLWPVLTEAPTAVLLAVPLRADSLAIGTLSVSRADADRPYDIDDERFLQELADRAGLAVARAQLFAQVRANEERLRLAVETNRIVAWEWVPAADSITTSENFAQIYGLPALAGAADGFALVWPEDVPAHQEKVSRIAGTGGSYRSTFRITRPADGKMVWLEEFASAIKDGDGRVTRVVGIAQDVTERKRGEAALLASEAHARFLAEASEVLAASLDDEEAVAQVVRLAVPLLADWCVVDLLDQNGTFRRIAVVHGDPALASVAEELRRCYPVISPDARHTAWSVLRSGQPAVDPDVTAVRLEDEFRDEAHRALVQQLGFTSELAVPLLARGRSLGVLILVMGDSGRRFAGDDVAFARELARHCALAIDNARLYREARDAEAKVRRLFDTGVIGLIVSDDEQIVEANDAFLAMVGYTRNDLEAGRLRWPAMTPPEYADLDARALSEIESRGFCTPFEKEYVRKDGTRVPILIGAAAVRRTEPPLISAVLDLSLQKAAERDRVAFVEAATHDLKTPLTSLKGRVQLLQRRMRRVGTLAPADLESSLTAIDVDVSRLVALIDDLMDMAHLRAGLSLGLRLAPTDLVALAESCAQDARQRSPRHPIRVAVETSQVVGEWDRARLERVVTNLLDNAVKYSRDGSVIEVGVGREKDERGEWAVLSVTDQGVGIPAADLARIFERFQRGGNVASFAGVGVGLAGARQIVNQHGGTIGVESAEGEGSTFTVRLPLAPAAENSPSPTEA